MEIHAQIVNWIFTYPYAIILGMLSFVLLVMWNRQRICVALLQAKKAGLQEETQSLQHALQQMQEKAHQAEMQAAMKGQALQQAQASQQTQAQMLQESLKTAELAMQTKGKEVLKAEAKEFTDHTMQAFTKLTERVVQLSSVVDQNDQSVSTLWKALEQPGLVGQLSEIGLENALKAHGLEAGQDFVMQYSSEGKRPDAVVFLPNSHALAVDSKASSFFLELAASETEAQANLVKQKLKKQMREHLKILAGKEYQTIVERLYKESNSTQDLMLEHKVAMFIHKESQLELLHQIDPSFRHDAASAGIMLVGPTGLGVLLNFASYSLQMIKQDANQKHIIEEITGLMDNLRVVVEHAAKLGDTVKRSHDQYQKLASSINRRLLPKAKKVEALGIILPKNKSLPDHIQQDENNVVALDVLEGE